MTKKVIKSWEATGGVFIDEVGFLKPGKALYLYDYVDSDTTTRKYVEGTSPQNQVDIDSVICDAVMRYESLYAILMSHQDFKAYNDGCVAKETVRF